MGFKPSPYYSIQGILFAEELIRGEPSDKNNVFQWDEIVLSLPGRQEYDLSKPWVYKIRSSDKRIAADFIIYVDDVRSAGNNQEEARLVARRIGSLMNWLGIQDAARKRWGPSSIVHIEGDIVTLSVSKDRWEKAKAIINWIDSAMQEGDTIEFKK